MYNYETGSLYCDNNANNCMGKGYHFGCPYPACVFGKNPIGECGCDKQFFIQSDCGRGFYCMNDVPDPWLYEGCELSCNVNEYLLPHFESGTWECVDATGLTCPGQFKIECEDDAFPNSNQLNSDYCDCPNGQFIVSPDCRHGFYCHSRQIGGGTYKECEPGWGLSIDRENWRWQCVTEDFVDCPGGGGFKIGCPEIPDFVCTYGANHIATCDGCENQVFMDAACQSTFLCTEFAPQGEEGCALDCKAGERVYMDLYAKDFWCEDESQVICPGAVSVDCPDQFGEVDIKCACDNEVWVNRDCTGAFFCSGVMSPTGENPGTYAQCHNDEIGYITWNSPDSFIHTY